MPRKTHLPLAALSALAALAVPAAAQGAASWSSPTQVLAPSGADGIIGLPSAFLTAQGASVALGSNGDGPHLAMGDAAGKFGPATALGTGPAQSTNGDLGADGTFAAAWGTDGTAHVAVVRPGQGPEVTDLPGTGANAVDVAVGPDGTVTAAWRTKSASSDYGLLTATAAPGAGFGEPTTLVAPSRSAIGSIDVDAGPDGAVAVVLQKGSPIRAHGALRPAGGVWDDVRALSANAQADQAPRVQIAGDGTAVAVWPNRQAGLQASLRAPGAAAWGAPATLGPAGEGAFAADLAPTPQGGTAVVWDAGGPVRVAVQPQGGAFGESTQVLTRMGQITGAPAIGVDPDGGVVVVGADPQSGAVQTVSPGGQPRTIGFGKPDSATAVDVAVGAGGQAVALWQDAEGGLSAATRSEQVAPGGSPGTPSAAPGRTAPRITIKTKARTFKVTRRTRTVTFQIASDEAGKVQVTGTLRTTRNGRRAIAPLTQVPVRALKAGTQTLTVKLNTLVLKDLHRAFKAKRRGQLLLIVSAKDAGGYETRKRVTFTLAEKTKRR